MLIYAGSDTIACAICTGPLNLYLPTVWANDGLAHPECAKTLAAAGAS